jgi:hypothetical protein
MIEYAALAVAALFIFGLIRLNIRYRNASKQEKIIRSKMTDEELKKAEYADWLDRQY